MKYEVDYSEVIKLQQKIAKLPNKMEVAVNSALHRNGVKFAKEEITKLIPVSAPRKRRQPKVHAKQEKWSSSKKENLGFTIKSKGGAANKPGSFGYLVFPNEGRGPSNPIEQRFMERGMEKAVPRILTKLNEKVDKTLEEALK